MGSFWSNFTNAPGGRRRRGLGRWFQILEDRFMTLFWANLMCMACSLIFLVSLFFFSQTGDALSLLGMVLGLVLLGPGMTAMHFLCIQTVRDKPVFLKEDFLGSIQRDWKQSAAFTLLIGLLWGTFAYALRLVTAVQGGLGLMYTLVFAVTAFVLTGLTIFGYQQIAMVQLPFYGVIKNAFLLIFAGKGRSFAAILFTMAVAGLCLWFYEYFVFILLLGVPALTVMTENLIFFPVFEELFPEESE